MKNHNIKKAIRIVMLARGRKIIWKLILQIIHDRPSAIVNAWGNMNQQAEWPPERIIITPGKPMKTIYHCQSCLQDVNCVGPDGRCGRCNPTLAG